MKKLTRKEKIRIDKQLKRESYRRGAHSVCRDNGETVVVVVKDQSVFLPSGAKLPVPEEWWI